MRVPVGEFFVLHVVTDLRQQIARLPREGHREDEVVDTVDDEEWSVLAPPSRNIWSTTIWSAPATAPVAK